MMTVPWTMTAQSCMPTAADKGFLGLRTIERQAQDPPASVKPFTCMGVVRRTSRMRAGVARYRNRYPFRRPDDEGRSIRIEGMARHAGLVLR